MSLPHFCFNFHCFREHILSFIALSITNCMQYIQVNSVCVCFFVVVCSFNMNRRRKKIYEKVKKRVCGPWLRRRSHKLCQMDEFKSVRFVVPICASWTEALSRRTNAIPNGCSFFGIAILSFPFEWKRAHFQSFSRSLFFHILIFLLFSFRHKRSEEKN